MNKKSIVIVAAFFLSAHLFGAMSSAKAEDPKSVQNSEEEMWDPIEPVNRGIFWFNDKFDRYLLEPASQGYDWAVPDRVKTGVGNFFSNLKYPITLVSDIIQFRFLQAAKDTGRFVLNTTAGVAGIFDVASEAGLKQNKDDLGVAFARYGMPSGPYLVIPFLGPSSLRDGTGLLGEAFLTPSAMMVYARVDSRVNWYVSMGTEAVEFTDKRAKLGDAIKAAHEGSVDYYLFVQSAYYQHRKGLIAGERSAKEILKDED